MQSRRLVILGSPGGTPANTVAPVISATAVIGTQITGDDGTWVPAATSYAYQWQRYTGGAWADITGATSKNYTPTDSDFGLALRLVVTATPGKTATSNSTGLTAEAPVQTLGPVELLVNGNFSAWTGDNPDNWTVTGEVGSDPMVAQVDPAGGEGTGAAKLYSSATNLQPRMNQAVLTSGAYYEQRATITAWTAGSIDIGDGVGLVAYSGAGTKINLLRARSTSSMVRAGSNAPINFVVDNATTKLITLNTQLVAPLADMKLDQYYTLPGSPLPGTQIWLYSRISNFSAGNFWKVELIYNGSQWNINLYSVATFTKTSHIAATTGASNGVRINMNGDQISLWTTADGGANWTQRGTTITNNTYQTATGVNALWTSDVTPGNLVYAVAT